MSKYDYLVVGAGLYGAVFAHEAAAAGKKVLVIDRRPNIAGNVYTEDVEKIHVHKYGAHIFHTNDGRVWDYVQKFATFNRFTNSPVANFHGELYSLPFNMYTFNKMWGVVTPEEAAEKIESQRREAGITEPRNLEEQAISLVGTDIYEKLIKGYTEKQWGRPCTELPAFIIKRLPVRLTFDNNYFNALYQGIPVGGYTKMVAAMLGGAAIQTGEDFGKDAVAVSANAQPGSDAASVAADAQTCGNAASVAADAQTCGNAASVAADAQSGNNAASVAADAQTCENETNVGCGSIEVHVGVDFFDESGAPRKDLRALADRVVYTGAIDAYFGYKLGYLEYRSVRFENELLDKPNFQGNAAVNYTDRETPWTRIIEHKWFEFGKDDEGNDIPKTVISREYSSEWKPGDEPYYPVNDEKNGKLYEEYKKLADAETGVIFGGRLGEYKYYDMDKVIASALDMCERELG